MLSFETESHSSNLNITFSSFIEIISRTISQSKNFSRSYIHDNNRSISCASVSAAGTIRGVPSCSGAVSPSIFVSLRLAMREVRNARPQGLTPVAAIRRNTAPCIRYAASAPVEAHALLLSARELVGLAVAKLSGIELDQL